MGRRGALIVVAVATVVALVAWRAWPGDSENKLPVSQALIEFRQAMRSAEYPPRPHAEIPPFGVYRYATRGSEDISASVASAGHDYGGVSTIVLTPSGCGLTERWQPLVERWIETRFCLSRKGVSVAELTEFHEFFGRGEGAVYRCVGVAPPAPSMRVGMGWTADCRSEDGTARSSVRVLGIEPVRVAGQRIPAVHLSSRVMLAGDPEGLSEVESWLRRSDGLVLRRVSSASGKIDVAGGVRFSERYRLSLISTRPQR